MSPVVGRIVIAWFACRLLWALVVYLRGLVYDLREIRQKQARQAHPYARKYRIKPLVSIIIIASNAEATIEQCLKSIVRGSYRKYEIIVVDNASVDGTIRAVARCISRYPKQKIRMVRQHERMSREALISSLDKGLYNGELMLLLDTESILEPQALKNAVRHFAASGQADTVTLNTQLRFSKLSLLSCMQHFDFLLRAKRLKLQRGANVYARDAVVTRTRPPAQHFNRMFKRFYDQFYGNPSLENSVLTATHSQKKYRKNTVSPKKAFVPKRVIAPAARIAVPLFDVLAFVYLAYLAIVLQNTLLFAASWFVLLAVLAVAVWSDSSLPASEKWVLTALLPVAYVFLLAASVVKLAARTAAAAATPFSRVSGGTVRAPS